MDDDLDRLRSFAAVAEHLHFGRAAVELHISRPALSRIVTDLEAALGVELFVRPSERTELTPAGHDLVERARIELAAAAARELVAAAAADAAGAPVFTVAIMPGVTVSKWSKIWNERSPEKTLRILRTDVTTQRSVLLDGHADVGFVRLPLDVAGLSTIPLYAEVPVVVLGKDHHLAALAAVSVADLVEEHLLQTDDDVPQWRDAALALRKGPRRPLPEMATFADAIALVAAGVGVVIVPMSVARLHHRGDVTYRPVAGVPPYEVALAWSTERTTDLVEEFIGIVRGRSARSSRSTTSRAAATSSGPAQGTGSGTSSGRGGGSEGKNAEKGKAGKRPAKGQAPTPGRRGPGPATGSAQPSRGRSSSSAKSRRPRGSR